jgi:hypothetical protein
VTRSKGRQRVQPLAKDEREEPDRRCGGNGPDAQHRRRSPVHRQFVEARKRDAWNGGQASDDGLRDEHRRASPCH